MGIIPFAFIIGFVLWLSEHRAEAESRAPAPCHYCACAGEINIVHWDSGWVHANGSRYAITALDADVGRILGRDPYAHAATPRTATDEMLVDHAA